MLDAAIIGGGPVGLATAAALLQAKEPVLTVQVFERMEEMKPCGAGVFLASNGFRALHAIHQELYASIKDVTIAVDAHVKYLPDGNVTNTHHNPELAKNLWGSMGSQVSEQLAGQTYARSFMTFYQLAQCSWGRSLQLCSSMMTMWRCILQMAALLLPEWL